MASKARIKKIAERIFKLESLRSNPDLQEYEEREIENLCLKSHLSVEELFEIDELVLQKMNKK